MVAQIKRFMSENIVRLRQKITDLATDRIGVCDPLENPNSAATIILRIKTLYDILQYKFEDRSVNCSCNISYI